MAGLSIYLISVVTFPPQSYVCLSTYGVIKRERKERKRKEKSFCNNKKNIMVRDISETFRMSTVQSNNTK